MLLFSPPPPLHPFLRAGNPVAPRRKKKSSPADVDSCLSPVSKLPPIPQLPERPQCPVPSHNNALVLSGPQSGYEVVVAQYDCDPDHPDELGFMEGDKLVVVKRLNQDWWVSIIKKKENTFVFLTFPHPMSLLTCSKVTFKASLERLVCFQ